VKNKALPTIVRSIVLLGLGAFVLLYETVVIPPKDASPLLIAAALACLGVEGGISVKRLGQDPGKPETPSTAPSSSQSSSP
jgi:hypothetical protein